MTELYTGVLVVGLLVLVGLAIPWAAWGALGWRGLALAALVLLLRRPPFVLGLAWWVRPLRTRRDALFVG